MDAHGGRHIIDQAEKQRSLHLDVAYFDEQEKRKLLDYPTSSRIQEIVSTGLSVPTAQFLTYYLYYRKRPGKPGYRNYTEISFKIERALIDLAEWVEFKDGSLVSAPDAAPQDRGVVERIGEAGALCVMGRLHDLHEADWEKIPEHSGRKGFPTFDYRHGDPAASDGERIIQVEAKGSSVEDTAKIADSVRQQKKRIEDRKGNIRGLEVQGIYPYPADLRYGVVCAVGRNGPLRCWLVDPPAEGGRDPRRHRLLARLQFMFDWISFLSVRSQFAASFATRLAALYALRDPFELDRVPLMRGNGKSFSLGSFFLGRPSGFFAHLCQVTDGPAVGTLLRLPRGELFFIGVQREIFEMAEKQDFETILRYRNNGGSVPKSVRCVIPRGRARTMDILELDDGSQRDPSYIHFNAEGLLHYSEGGSVFGIVEHAGREPYAVADHASFW